MSVDKLKAQMLTGMQAKGLTKLETANFRLSVCKNGGVQPMTIEDGRVTDDYKVQPPPIPDKEKIRATLETGLLLPFAKLEERGKHLRIT